jgi:hypothetical protein
MSYQPAHITSIPNAITFLVNLFQTTCPYDSNNEPITIWLGEELGVFSAPTTIEINGVDPVDRQWASLGPNYLIEEDYSIKCKVSSFTGEGSSVTDFLSVMDSVWTIWEALEMGIMVDPTLGGYVRVCWFDETIYEPTTDGTGRAMAAISWVIKCEARVTTIS